MEETPEIKDLPQLIQPYLGDNQLVSYTSRYLTKPGDHYGSLMISVTANIKNPRGDVEELPLIAKLPPITNDFYWKIFQPERTCLSENAAYKFFAPEIRKLQMEMGVRESDLFESFPKFYGSRISLNPKSEIVDRDAVLVLENLQTAGYKAGNRHKMYDLTTTNLVIRELAKYHALPLALRLKRPDVFEKKIRPFYRRFDLNANLSEEEKFQLANSALKEVELATNNNGEMVDRVKEALEQFSQHAISPDTPDGPFVSIAHCDLWINNIMLKYDEFGTPYKLKFVDFQIAQMDHVAHDIIFFLFSSLDTNILEQHYYDFLQLYYNEFIKCLKSVGVSTENYNFQVFLDEVHGVGTMEIWHALFMTKIILADKNTMPENFKDMSLTVMGKNLGFAQITQKTAEILRLAQKFKLI